MGVQTGRPLCFFAVFFGWLKILQILLTPFTDVAIFMICQSYSHPQCKWSVQAMKEIRNRLPIPIVLSCKERLSQTFNNCQNTLPWKVQDKRSGPMRTSINAAESENLGKKLESIFFGKVVGNLKGKFLVQSPRVALQRLPHQISLVTSRFFVEFHSDCNVVLESLSQLVPLQTSRFRDFAHPFRSSFK